VIPLRALVGDELIVGVVGARLAAVTEMVRLRVELPAPYWSKLVQKIVLVPLALNTNVAVTLVPAEPSPES
jgi:hypothetical protein